MDVLELLRRVYVAGAIVLLTDHGMIKLCGRRVPDNMRQELLNSKSEIISTLISQDIGAIDPGYSGARQYVVPTTCMAGNACHHLGPCSRFLMYCPCDPKELPDDGKQD